MFTATSFGQEDIVRDNLVVWLDANDRTSYPGTGTVWGDLSRNGFNGTLTNGPTYTSSFGGFIRCDGTNDFIEVTDNSSLDFGSGSFTVEYWFRKLTGTVSFSNIWGPNKWTLGAANTGEWLLLIGNGSTSAGGNNYGFSVQVGSTNYTTGNSSETLSLNVWYQLIGMRSGNSLRTYVNSVLKQNVTPSGFTTSSIINNVANMNLRINNSMNNSNYTNADNSIIRVYNRALTQSEINQNFNANRIRFNI
jgi:hypothetical protein